MADPGTRLTTAEIDALGAGAHGDPFGVLGPHRIGATWVIRVLLPDAETVEAVAPNGQRVTLVPLGNGVFEGAVPGADRPLYRLYARNATDAWEAEDPYRFAPRLGALDEHLLSEGTHDRLWDVLGAHPVTHEGVEGVHFAVWAPNASRVSVVGDHNRWDGRRHPMRLLGATGVWELFVPGLGDGARYKYEIRAGDGTILPLKADPVAFGSEHPPATASVVRGIGGHDWDDAAWMEGRAARHAPDAPISIYEVHLGSWQRTGDEGRMLSYPELADRLVPYVADLGFTHIELLPITEHPFDGSWGYQPTGLFAPTIRHGTPDELRQFVARCHAAGLGVLLDWVPGHFPEDAHGLARFDGTALYEHADPREGVHRDWSTLIYNYGRREVQNFLIASAQYWLSQYHLDGIRVDAVASMLYRDYSREPGEWVPNVHGGRENLEAVAFLRRLNSALYGADPSILTVAEESTAWPGVTRRVDQDGLGFGYKWNMGWMNDTLGYLARDPVHRRHHHNQMTFGLTYAFSETFVLPISHDEVVHGKGSMLGKIPGDETARFATLRAFYGFMWGHPGKKLLFMGQEFAQPREWAHDRSLDWDCLDDPRHAGVQRLVRDLNTLYRGSPALHRGDADTAGFAWVEADAADLSVYAWLRRAGDAPPVLVAANFTPVPRTLSLGVPQPGHWAERLNTDAAIYGGTDSGNLGGVETEPRARHGHAHSIRVLLPAFSTLFFEHRA